VFNNKPDVLVIGGGVIGVCAAYYAANEGRRVTLVERGEIGSGCSWGNAGWVVPSHCIPLAAPGVLAKGLKWMWSSSSPFSIRPRLDLGLMRWLVAFVAACNENRVRKTIPILRDLTFASLDLYRELYSLEGMSGGYSEDGSLMLFATKRGLAEGRRDAEMLGENGIRSQEWGSAEIVEREPSIVPGMAGGIFYPDDAHLLPGDFLDGLARTCEGLGVEIMRSTSVTGFDLEKEQISVVRTTQGDFRPECVVLAAGCESSTLGRNLGLDWLIQAGKGYSFSISSSTARPSKPLLLSEAKVAVTPFGDKVRFAGTLELSGLDYSVNEKRLNAIRDSSSKYFVQSLPLIVEEKWSGLRPCTPDGLPIISPVSRVKNLIVASGHAMLGISLGPITGKLVAQLACHEPPDIDLSSLSIGRFLS